MTMTLIWPSMTINDCHQCDHSNLMFKCSMISPSCWPWKKGEPYPWDHQKTSCSCRCLRIHFFRLRSQVGWCPTSRMWRSVESVDDSWLFSWENWSPETPESHGFWHCFDHHDDGGVRVQFSNEWSDARLFKTFQYQDCHRHSVGMSRLILDGLQLNVRNNDGREVNHLLNPKFEITWCWGLKKEQWSERWWNFRW